MPNPKQIIPVSEVKPGDSIRIGTITLSVIDVFAGDTGRYVMLDGYLADGSLHAFHALVSTDTCTVGYTNRKAKRARGKMSRRARLGFAPRPRFVGRENFQSLDVRLDWGFVQAQSDRLASSVSPAEDAAIIRQTRIAGRSPGKT